MHNFPPHLSCDLYREHANNRLCMLYFILPVGVKTVPLPEDFTNKNSYWRSSLSIGLAVLFFYSKTGFWPSYCAISQPIWIKFCTHTDVRNTPVGRADLDRNRRVGGSRPNQNDCFSVILVTRPKTYIKTTDRHDFGGKPSKWRWKQMLAIVKNSGIL